MNDIETLVDAESEHLIAALEDLDHGQWNAPSLCAGWSIRDVVIHLLMPYELSFPRFLLKMAAARFNFDRLAYRWATEDARSAAEASSALRGTAQQRFGIPGAPPEAPLSHLVIHAEDVYRPLGLRLGPSPASAIIVLDQQTGPRFRGSLPAGLLDGLAYTATDTDWTFGEGLEVAGSASALIATFAGRTAALDELSGGGAFEVRTRLLSADHARRPPPTAR